jgi:hypothetical protein
VRQCAAVLAVRQCAAVLAAVCGSVRGSVCLFLFSYIYV